MKSSCSVCFFLIAIIVQFGITQEENPFPIERKEVTEPPPILYESEEQLSNGLILREYFVTPTYLCAQSLDGSKERIKPTSEKERIIPRLSTQQVLEKAGIKFSAKGSKATYSPTNSKLTVVLPRSEMDLVDSYVRAVTFVESKQIAIRLEVFEAPTLTAIEIVNSCTDHAIHTSERNALLQAKKAGQPKSIGLSFLTLIARPGERAGSQSDTLSAEIEALLGADDKTVDLQLAIDIGSIEKNTYTTSITCQSDNFYLIGSWKNNEGQDRTYLLFIRPVINKA